MERCHRGSTVLTSAICLGAALSVLVSPRPAPAQSTPQPQVGLAPLTELEGELYKGAPGGLYPGGHDELPEAHPHFEAAMEMARQIVPLDRDGDPDSTAGKVVMVSIGMSNTTHEFAVFERREDLNESRNAKLVIVNGAKGGKSSCLIADRGDDYWQTVMGRLDALGLGRRQVQVAWLKEGVPVNLQECGDPDPVTCEPGLPSFCPHTERLHGDLRTIAGNLRFFFPNLRLCYLSSRTYGGWDPDEPDNYESAFAVRWVIEDQMAGDPDLNHDPRRGEVKAPLLLWGPYLWADGTSPRRDGLTWEQADFEPDGRHPSPSGEEKVAAMLSDFFAADPTAQPWFPARSGHSLQAIDATDDATVDSDRPDEPFGTTTELYASGGQEPLRNVYLRFDLSDLDRPVLFAKLSLRVTTRGVGGGEVSVVSDTDWSEETITFENAPSIDPGTIAEVPASTRDGTFSADVTGAVNDAIGGPISFALTTRGNTSYHSRESGQPPRLILVTARREGGRQIPGDCNQDGAVDISDALCIFGFLFLGSPGSLPCGDGSGAHPGNVALIDWQPDGAIDLSDGVAMLQFLFSGGPRHPLAVPGRETSACVPIRGCPENGPCR